MHSGCRVLVGSYVFERPGSLPLGTPHPGPSFAVGRGGRGGTLALPPWWEGVVVKGEGGTPARPPWWKAPRGGKPPRGGKLC